MPAPVTGELLAEVGAADWAVVLARTSRRELAPGEVAVAVGEQDAALYVVVEGAVEVLLPARRLGRLRSVGALTPGAVFGEISFFDGLPRTAQVRAVSATVLARLDRAGFADLATERPDLATLLLLDLGRVLAGRVRVAERRLA